MRVFLTQLRCHSDNFGANFERAHRVVERSRLTFSSEDVLLLPELVGGEAGCDEYDDFTSRLARRLGCYVVAGSHHEADGRGRVNRGAVANPRGDIISRYDKSRPYGIESKLGVVPGKSVGRFDIGECHVLVLVCADFWYSDIFLNRLSPRPDLILVPTFSISLRSSPRAARSLWRSMAVSRAYEFSVYVGISDWAHPCEYQGLKSSSVGGLADPRPRDQNGFFARIGREEIADYTIDIVRLRQLRDHRKAHAFLSDETLTGNYAAGRNRARASRTSH